MGNGSPQSAKITLFSSLTMQDLEFDFNQHSYIITKFALNTDTFQSLRGEGRIALQIIGICLSLKACLIELALLVSAFTQIVCRRKVGKNFI
jgi:hypothetical protein